MAEETVITDTSPTFFSGWRPLIGWIIATGLAIQFIIIPITNATSSFFGHPLALPSLDTGPLVSLTTGVLGLGGLRTVEKVLNVAQK